jgi:1,4-alpha-glucan branching enzyme
MLVNPRLLFLYWVLDEGLRARLREVSGPAEAIVEISADGRSFREAARHRFDFSAPSWYLHNDTVDCLQRLRLGIRSGDRFEELLRSEPLRIPRTAAGDAPEVWMRPAELRRSPAGTAPLTPRRAGAEATQAAGGWAGGATSPGGAPHFTSGRRGALTDRPALEGGAPGDLCLVLHSHLPFVRHPERDFFLEENWLFEAITETYLPLLDMFDHLQADGVPGRVTVSLTPTLMAMLRDRVLIDKYERHLARTSELARREVERTRRDPDFGPVAGFYRDRLERLRWLLADCYGHDPVGRFVELERDGRIEIITCAATHGLLPHLRANPGSVRAQIAAGVAEHVRQAGRPPRGIWLPECAYFEGLDALLAEHGLEYFFVDARALHHASSRPRFGVHAPILCPSGVAAFGRDEECSEQVWSAERGYPGDPAYRDFYRDIGYDLPREYVAPFLDPSGERGMTGLKYHRITGRHDHKEPYGRVAALRAVERHADEFVRNRALQARRLAAGLDRRPLLVAMYDAELFGHWWFEGPEWIEAVLRRLPEAGLRAVSPGEVLAAQPRLQVTEPAGTSWGAGGYYEVWLCGPTDWIYPPLHDAGRRMADLAARQDRPAPLQKRALTQLGRELLLAQSSDWPFILKNRTAEEYARRRLHEHLDRFAALARQVEEGAIDEGALAALEARDNLFPDLDPGLWRSA